MTPEWASHGPALFIFLFFVVLLRAQATYWLGRLAASGAVRGKERQGVVGAVARWFDGPVPARGAALLERWGLIVIPLCFLTVGIQTAVNAGAGLVRMKWRTYTIAMLPGCVAWAALYGMGLLAVWAAAIGALAGNPWALGALVLVGAGLGFASWHRHHRRAATPDERCPALPEAEAEATDLA